VDLNSIATPDWSSLPAPVDDGAARHLVGMRWPAGGLAATDGRMVDVSKVKGWCVVFGYPRTGRPGVENPAGWDLIAGARGCTPQSCAFRDRFAELKAAGVEDVFGLSTQVSEYQREAAERLHLPYALLSDADLTVTRALRLPTFEIQGSLEGQGDAGGREEETKAVLLKRVTLMVREGVIEHVFYPVFPPDENAGAVIEWMKRLARW
jgi:peroxiredoxin